MSNYVLICFSQRAYCPGYLIAAESSHTQHCQHNRSSCKRYKIVHQGARHRAAFIYSHTFQFQCPPPFVTTSARCSKSAGRFSCKARAVLMLIASTVARGLRTGMFAGCMPPLKTAPLHPHTCRLPSIVSPQSPKPFALPRSKNFVSVSKARSTATVAPQIMRTLITVSGGRGARRAGWNRNPSRA